ncbi:MAG TPA: hypothetical protein VIF37_06480 [Methylobacter sp.]|jgi:hypothetical protein
MSTIKQREKIVKNAIAAMDKAAEALSELSFMAIECGLTESQMQQEEHFRSGLRERSAYWERVTWWRNDQ